MALIRNPGRVVGVWYLLLVFSGPLSLLYIPNKLFVTDNAAATAANIAAHQTLLRVGMLSDLVGAVILIFLTLAFYRLFKDVDRDLAILLVISGGIMPAVINFVNFVNEAGALMVSQSPAFLSAFDSAQQAALAYLFIRLRHWQIVAAEILWGLWLFPMGLLAYKSRFVPRFIGVWLLLNGAAYVLLSVVGLFAPAYQDKVWSYSQPLVFGEIAIMLWLLIKGSPISPATRSDTPAPGPGYPRMQAARPAS
jgi:Domain of unknown function (DUF4386)